jgi:hypothetical protein
MQFSSFLFKKTTMGLFGNGHVHILSALIGAGADVNAVSNYSSYKKNDTDEALDV